MVARRNLFGPESYGSRIELPQAKDGIGYETGYAYNLSGALGGVDVPKRASGEERFGRERRSFHGAERAVHGRRGGHGCRMHGTGGPLELRTAFHLQRRRGRHFDAARERPLGLDRVHLKAAARTDRPRFDRERSPGS